MFEIIMIRIGVIDVDLFFNLTRSIYKFNFSNFHAPFGNHVHLSTVTHIFADSVVKKST